LPSAKGSLPSVKTLGKAAASNSAGSGSTTRTSGGAAQTSTRWTKWTSSPPPAQEGDGTKPHCRWGCDLGWKPVRLAGSFHCWFLFREEVLLAGPAENL